MVYILSLIGIGRVLLHMCLLFNLIGSMGTLIWYIFKILKIMPIPLWPTASISDPAYSNYPIDRGAIAYWNGPTTPTCSSTIYHIWGKPIIDNLVVLFIYIFATISPGFHCLKTRWDSYWLEQGCIVLNSNIESSLVLATPPLTGACFPRENYMLWGLE